MAKNNNGMVIAGLVLLLLLFGGPMLAIFTTPIVPKFDGTAYNTVDVRTMAYGDWLRIGQPKPILVEPNDLLYTRSYFSPERTGCYFYELSVGNDQIGTWYIADLKFTHMASVGGRTFWDQEITIPNDRNVRDIRVRLLFLESDICLDENIVIAQTAAVNIIEDSLTFSEAEVVGTTTTTMVISPSPLSFLETAWQQLLAIIREIFGL